MLIWIRMALKHSMRVSLNLHKSERLVSTDLTKQKHHKYASQNYRSLYVYINVCSNLIHGVYTVLLERTFTFRVSCRSRDSTHPFHASKSSASSATISTCR